MPLSFEDFLKANLAGRANVDVPAIGQAAVKGIELSETIKSNKLKRMKEEQDLKKEIEQALAQKNFVQAAQQKEIAPRTFEQRVPQEQVSMGLEGTPLAETLGKKATEAKMIASTEPLQAQRRQEEQARVQPLNEKIGLQNALVGYQPEDVAKSMLKASEPQKTTSRYQQGTAEINGQVANVIFDTHEGKYKDNAGNPLQGNLVRGFRPSVLTDPNTGELIRVTSGGVESGVGGQAILRPGQEITDPLDLNVRQSNRLQELRQSFDNDDVVKSNRVVLNTIGNLRTVQAQGLPALIGSLQSLRARGIAGEKGVLTEKDVERTTGSPQLARRFMNALTKLALGQENPQNVAEFMQAIDAVEKAAASRNQQVEASFIERAKATKELSQVSPELIKQQISIGTEPFKAGTPEDSIANLLGLKKKAGVK